MNKEKLLILSKQGNGYILERAIEVVDNSFKLLGDGYLLICYCFIY